MMRYITPREIYRRGRKWFRAKRPVVKALYILVFVLIPTVYVYYQMYEGTSSMSEGSSESLVEAAIEYCANEQYEEALSLLNKARERDPRNAEVSYVLGVTLHQLLRCKQSNDVLLGIAKDQKTAGALFVIGQNYYKLGDRAASMKYLSEAEQAFRKTFDRTSYIVNATILASEVKNYDNGRIEKYARLLESEIKNTQTPIEVEVGTPIPLTMIDDRLTTRGLMNATGYVLYSGIGEELYLAGRKQDASACFIKSLTYKGSAFAPCVSLDPSAVLLRLSALLIDRDCGDLSKIDGFKRLGGLLRVVTRTSRTHVIDMAGMLYQMHCRNDTTVTVASNDVNLAYRYKVAVNRAHNVAMKITPPVEVGKTEVVLVKDGDVFDRQYHIEKGTVFKGPPLMHVVISDAGSELSFVLLPYLTLECQQ